jgi:hypothetical protein
MYDIYVMYVQSMEAMPLDMSHVKLGDSVCVVVARQSQTRLALRMLTTRAGF